MDRLYDSHDADTLESPQDPWCQLYRYQLYTVSIMEMPLRPEGDDTN